jgi:two-component system chemotaxis sensor kinase CheA
MVFGPDSLRDGMDPLAMVNHLARQGPLLDLSLDTERLPPLDQLAPEDCHIALRFGTDGQLSRAAIESAFSFVLADSQLRVEPASAGGAAESALPPAAAVAPVAAAEGATSAAPVEEPRYIRVQADRLDAVINLLGELVIAGASASLLARQAGQRRLLEANAQVSQLIEEIRNSTLKMRMVPIGETFARFRRVVRDTAAELGKDVQLELVGSETELDKSVVERIADPLMHLVRNALDHGLEPPEQRQQAGKPATGRLVLSARHESGSVLIRIQDDGRGIQRRKVLERAWQRGLLEAGTVPSDAEIDQLIFEPGFSTAETVTNLSGRGVGMDVVRRNIEALRGSVQLSSTPGQGSCIDIRLPLTLAIIDGFLVGVDRSRFIFPLEAVLEVVEPGRGTQRFDARGRGLLELRGRSLPVVNLRALYGLDGEPTGRSSVVVLQAGDRRYGVMVDALLGQHQTVIKPLSRLFSSLRGVSGSSVLATGEVALIVDVHALGTLAASAPATTPSFRPSPAPGAHLSLAPVQGTLS